LSENYKVQASFKFGLGQTGMLNFRADSPEELGQILDRTGGADLLDKISGINAVIKALDAVDQAGLQPQVVPAQQAPPATPLQQYQQGVQQSAQQPTNEWTQPAQPQVAPPAGPGAALPVCIHGPKGVISKDGPKGRWWAYACPGQKADPTKCDLDFGVAEPHKSLAKYL
jgi:hypothetical protein